MKNIKFRAWSEDASEMVQVARLDIKEETIYYENGIKSLNREQELGFWWKPYVLMQYTGLKDKNGVHIFEGDILKAYPNNTIYIGKVYYEDGQWFGACDYLDYAVAYSGAEVIGNIYQNKDLLEEEE